MKSKLYIFVLFFSIVGYSQNNDSITRIDSTDTIQLKEITVLSQRNKAGTYQLIMPKQILAGETLDKTIKRVTFITVDSNKSLYFKGKKVDNILLNDRSITIEDFNKLKVEDIKSISIVSNYFNQTTGNIENIIKVTEKKKYFNNVKGSIDFAQGFLQKFNSYGISVSNKFNNISSRLYLSNINNQTDNNYYQNTNNNIQNISNNRELSQPYISLQNILDIDETSSFYIKNKYSIVDDKTNSFFSNLNRIQYDIKIKNYSLNLRYDKNFKDLNILKLNFDYINFNNSVNSTEQISYVNSNSKQKFNEYTFSPLLITKGNKYELTNSLVMTYRDYNFRNTLDDNQVSQNLITYLIGCSLKINDRNSLYFGNRYQFEDNNIENKKSHYILPNLIYSVRIDSIANIEFNFKRNIQRPSINSISKSIYLDNNGNEIVNSDFLLPQIDNLFGIDIMKEFKKFNINVSTNYNFSKNYLTSVYSFNDNYLTNTAANITEFSEKSLRGSLSMPIYEEAVLNFNYSLSKLKFKQDGTQLNGFVNHYDVSFSGPILKKYLFSVNSFYTDRFYDYNAFYKAKPDFSVSLSTNYLKDKLNMNLELRNVLNQDSNRVINFNQDYNSYYQNSKNQARLLLVSLTYNFGKNFKMSRKTIQDTNNDIKIK